MRRWDRELNEEMQTHLEERAAELMRDGMSAREARERARREFGNITSLREQSRDVWRWASIDELWRAIVHAARSLRRGGAYTVVSVVTLALGIGVNTAIFSIIDAVLLRPLPYSHPEQLVRAGEILQIAPDAKVMTPQFVAWRNENRSFTALVSLHTEEYTLTGAGEPERVPAAIVPANFLSLLGLRPAMGRDFSESNDRPGAPRVALISDALWRRHWNGDTSVIGRGIILNDAPAEVVGVLPAGFRFRMRAIRRFCCPRK
jgi:putative ABC transport system permease protein